MNDQFLYQAQPEVDEEFANQLYKRLKAQGTTSQTPHKPKAWWIKRAAIAIILLVSIVLAFTPNAWAALQGFAQGIQQRLNPSSKLIGNIIVVDLPEASTPQPAQESPTNITPIPSVYISVDDIEEETGLELDIPTGAPSECTLNPEALTWRDDAVPSAHITWTCSNADGEGEIHLFVTDAPMITRLPADSYDVVHINENPVLIIRGIWTSNSETGEDRQWSLTDGMIRLTWDDGNYLYQMWSPGAFVNEKDLLEIVATIYK